MKDLVKHKIAKEIYADGKAFLWGCLVSLLTLCIVMLCDWLECLNDDYYNIVKSLFSNYSSACHH